MCEYVCCVPPPAWDFPLQLHSTVGQHFAGVKVVFSYADPWDTGAERSCAAPHVGMTAGSGLSNMFASIPQNYEHMMRTAHLGVHA